MPHENMCECRLPSSQALLPLFGVQLAELAEGLFLPTAFALLAALGPTMWHLWIYIGSANSNFFYAITLLFGAWQVRIVSCHSQRAVDATRVYERRASILQSCHQSWRSKNPVVRDVNADHSG